MEYSASPFELKALAETGEISGLLAGFGDCDLVGDRLLPGCLSKSLASRTSNIPMLFCHRADRPIGAWKSWREDGTGLFVDGKLTMACADAREAHALVQDGGLRALSIGWSAKRTAPGDDGERLVMEADIFEGSLVPVGAHPRARVIAAKDYANARDIADLLQDAGLSRRKAKLAAGAAWKAINEQDDDDANEAAAIALLKASIARINAIRRV